MHVIQNKKKIKSDKSQFSSKNVGIYFNDLYQKNVKKKYAKCDYKDKIKTYNQINVPNAILSF